MQFSDTTNKENGLIQMCESITGLGYGNISGNVTRLQEFTAWVNQDYKKTVADILKVDHSAQFDDNNHSTSIPFYSDDITSGTRTYTAKEDTNGYEFIRYWGVQVTDSSGNVVDLKQADASVKREILENNSTGTPTHYDQIGSKFILYPTPDYSLSDGIKFLVQRDPVLFTDASTTDKPGFLALFHERLALFASIQFRALNKSSNPTALNELKQQYEELRLSMKRHYATLNKESKLIITPSTPNAR